MALGAERGFKVKCQARTERKPDTHSETIGV